MSCGCGDSGTYEVRTADGVTRGGLNRQQADAIVAVEGGSVRKTG